MLLRLIPGTLLIALTFIVVAAAFAGIGLAVRRGFGLVALALDDCFMAFWMGFAAVLLFLLVWNFALPVGAAALTVVLVAGAAGLGLARRQVTALIEAHRGPRLYWTTGIVLLAACWIGNLSSGEMSVWDTALYHMQGVRWASQYPAVPGLANLFGPLGFNNTTLLYDAMLDVGPWAGGGWHIANGVLVLALVTHAVVSGARLVSRSVPPSPSDLFTFLLLAPALDMAVSAHLTSYVPDLGLTAVRFAAIALWFRFLHRKRDDTTSNAYDMVCIVALSAAAVAIKMNAVVFAALMVVTAAGEWLTGGGVADPLRGRSLRWCTAIALAFGIAWSGRGVVLSGYPLFPSTLLAAPVAWRVPAKHAKAEFDYVVHSTRATTGNVPYITGEVTGYRVWLPNWLRKEVAEAPYNAAIPTTLGLALLPFLLAGWRRAPPKTRDVARRGWWILLPVTIGLILWIAVAPAPRYATALFWTIPALLAAQLFAIGPWARGGVLARRLLVAALALGLSPALVNPLVEWRRGGMVGNPLKAIGYANVKVPEPGRWVRPATGQAVLEEYRTESGLLLNVPEHRCWDGDLPCTPNPAPNLRLRVLGRLDRGFVVDGEWQMLNWPEKWKSKYRAAWDESERRTGAAR